MITRAPSAVAIALWVTVCALPILGMAADAVMPGSHSSPGGVAPSVRPGSHGFKCGNGYCDARHQYCETIKTDVPTYPSDHACMPLPAACTSGPPSCACFPQRTRCDFCSVLQRPGGGSAFMRTCIGGY